MNIKKFSAAVTAAAVLAVAAPMTGMLPDVMSVTASAAEQKLITAAAPEELANQSFRSLGNGYYWVYNNYSESADKIVRIGDKELEQWRKTGTFTYTAVDSEVDLSGVSVYGMCDTKGYIRFSKNDVFYTMKIDENANKLVKVNEAAGALWITDDGYALSTTFSGEDWKYTVKTPDGKELEDTLSYTPSGEDDEAEVYVIWSDMDENVAFFAWKLPGTTVMEDPDNPWNSTAKYEIYSIKKDGSRELLNTVTGAGYDETGTYSPFISNAENHIAWFDRVSGIMSILTLDDGKIHKLSNLEFFDGVFFNMEVFGSKAAVDARVIDISGESKVLLDLSGGATAYISAIDNGNMYVSYTLSNSPTFYDSTFKEIKEFDKGSDKTFFVNGNLYAGVSSYDENGSKCFIIDKNLNQVSETIDDNGWLNVIGKELFTHSYYSEEGYKTEFMTFANSTSTSTPDKPAVKVVNYSDKTTGITASANKGVIAEGAEFTAEPIAEETKDNKLVYDFKFTKGGNEVQPKGSVTVKLPVPEALKGKTVYVYRAEKNGKFTKMNTKVEGGFITFTTAHFSKYIVTDEVIEGAETENPNTGVTGLTTAFGLIAVTGACVIVGKKRK